MHKLSKLQKGFTLAEVLVTLTIIGVIASLTIPDLIQRTNEQQYNSGIKKAMSELSQAIITIQNNNDGVVHVGTDDTITGHNALRTDFCSVMSCIKLDTVSNIFGTNGANYKFYNGNAAGWPAAATTPSAILSDGVYLMFYSYDNCSINAVNPCGYINVDINGAKSPNMTGLDFYEFWIIKNNGNYSIIPFGTQGDGRSCVDASATWPTSAGCTAQRLLNPDNMP